MDYYSWYLSFSQALYAAYKHYTEKETDEPIKRASEIISGWCRTHGVEASLTKAQNLTPKNSDGAAMIFDVEPAPLEAYIDPTDKMELLDKLSQVWKFSLRTRSTQVVSTLWNDVQL